MPSQQPFNASNAPDTCLWCGRKLYRQMHSEYERIRGAYVPPTHCDTEFPNPCPGRKFTPCPDEGPQYYTCDTCGRICRGNERRRLVSRRPIVNGAKPGRYGDGYFCGLGCGYRFGLAFAEQNRRLQPRKGMTA